MNATDTTICPSCRLAGATLDKRYTTVYNGIRLLLQCEGCGTRFSETHGTPMAEIKTPISKVALALRIRSGLCHEFLRLTFEGDEMYTSVGKRVDPSQSSGWTAVIMERGSRFLVDQRCGKKDADLFASVTSSIRSNLLRTLQRLFGTDMTHRRFYTFMASSKLPFCPKVSSGFAQYHAIPQSIQTFRPCCSWQHDSAWAKRR